MDLARFEILETHVTALVEAFVQIKTENLRLSQEIERLQGEAGIRQKELQQLSSAREELQQLRATLQNFQKERHVIQQKLQKMLATIAWLEELTGLEGDARA